jgi:hypothetical protein
MLDYPLEGIMRFLSLILLSSLFSVGCATQNKPHKSPYVNYKKEWSFQHQVAHYKTNNTKRVPANKKSNNPALEELIAQVRANPQFLVAPVGKMIKTDISGVNEDGQAWNNTQEQVYIHSHRFGYFTLQRSIYDNNYRLELVEENNDIDEIADFLRNDRSTKVEKISATEYKLTTQTPPEDGNLTCSFIMDLKSSIHMIKDNRCIDANGKIVYAMSAMESQSVNLADYKQYLENTKMNIQPLAIECEGDANCSSYLTDESERNWSYLIK